MKRPSAPSRDPAGALRLLDEAGAHYAAGRLEAATAAWRRAERADPSDFRAPMSLATLDLRRGRPDQALPRLRRVATLRPDLFEAQHNLGAAAQALALWEEAADGFERALALLPDAVESRRNLALVLAILGRIDAAEAHHRRLAADPDTRPWSLTRLALLKPAAITDADLDEMRRAAADPESDSDTVVGLRFALGEVLERRGLDDEAFASFAEGNRLKRRRLDADPSSRPTELLQAHREAAELVAGAFTPGFLARRAGAGLATAAPIFVVGMPRCGSTLIEQILASHPQVQALGETAVLPQLLESGELLRGAGQGPIRRLAREYLEAVRALGWRGAGRFVDKTLENYLHVGAIALMFPGAVILHAVRDPVDTCLSCYRQLFSAAGETMYDLAEIGAEYVTYRRLMEHWRAVLPGRIVDVDHEALVGEPDRMIPWLVTEACGLAWDDAALRFHEAAGPVRTASAAQVRQPIFRTSLQRWRRYERYLGPLLEALGPYAPARGAG